jgi:hypothetical protein
LNLYARKISEKAANNPTGKIPKENSAGPTRTVDLDFGTLIAKDQHEQEG